MTEGVQNLINAIAEGDSVGIESAFNQEMATRISDRLDDMRIDVARNMFRTESVQVKEEFEELDEAISAGEAQSQKLGQDVVDHQNAAKAAEKGSKEYHRHMNNYHTAAVKSIEHSEKRLGKAATPYYVGGGGEKLRDKDSHAAEAKKHAALAK